MRVIAVTEKDIKALMEQLEFEKLKLTGHQKPVDEIHRRFHYIVVCWLQEQGSSYPGT